MYILQGFCWKIWFENVRGLSSNPSPPCLLSFCVPCVDYYLLVLNVKIVPVL